MSTVQCLFILTALAAAFINVYCSDLVAFSVGKSDGFAPLSTSRILMNHVFYNDGNHFSLATNVFTAPVSGVYSFYFGGSGKRAKGTCLYLHAGNPEKTVATAYTNNHVAPNHVSGSVILNMVKGDMASVWLHAGHGLNPYNPPSTHFSGFLIK